MSIGKSNIPPAVVAIARDARATTVQPSHPVSSLLYQVLSALAWNG